VWVVVFLAVQLIPTYREEPLIFFPAVLALSAAWLVLAPQWSPLSPGAGLGVTVRPVAIRAVLDRLEQEVPDLEHPSEAATVEAADLLNAALPTLLDFIYARIGSGISVRAVQLGVIAVVGVLVGPWLQSMEFYGWQPVRILLGIATPEALLVFAGLSLGPITRTYATALRLRALDAPADSTLVAGPLEGAGSRRAHPGSESSGPTPR
jgi:hypothetical protein